MYNAAPNNHVYLATAEPQPPLQEISARQMRKQQLT
jgi:hypothetical protein